jgi:hypothetical protein
MNVFNKEPRTKARANKNHLAIGRKECEFLLCDVQTMCAAAVGKAAGA